MSAPPTLKDLPKTRLANAAPVLKQPIGAALRTTPGAEESARRRPRVLGNDVDDTVYDIRTPYRASWAPYDFDPVNILQRYVELIPVHSRSDGCVNAPAVDQNQNFVRIPAIKTADADGPCIGIDPRNVDAGHKTEQVENVGGS
jgi:hypothetical protein